MNEFNLPRPRGKPPGRPYRRMNFTIDGPAEQKLNEIIRSYKWSKSYTVRRALRILHRELFKESS